MLTVVEPQESTPKAIVKFAREQIRIQFQYGMTPDFEYPTDVISVAQLNDVIGGRSIVNENGELYGNPNNDEFDYRIWLYEMISHNFNLLGGDMHRLKISTQKALETTLLICVIRQGCSRLCLDDLRTAIMEPTGKRQTLNGAQMELLINVLTSISFAYLKKGVLIIDQQQARRELVKLKERPSSGSLIMSWADLRMAAKSTE